MFIFNVIEKIREISPIAANIATTHLLPRIIPLAKGLDVRVHEVTDNRCELSMPVKKRTRNHLNTMYFGAQMTLADLTVGVLLFRRFPPGPFGGVIKKVEADFKAKAKGTIRCICEISTDLIDVLEQARTNVEGKAEAWIPLQLVDEKDNTVTDVRFLVAVKRFV